MWILTPEQTRRLNALQRQRDLKRLGDVLAVAYPEAAARLGERFAEFVELGAQRASVHGLTHLLAVARYLACWVAFGTEMEQREPWAAALLRDSRRSQGARVHQLGVQTLESLRSQRQPGQPAPEPWAQGLVALDNALQDSGRLGTLGERERLKLGVACDLEAIDLRLTDSAWRQQYTATDGPWRREPCSAAVAAVTVQHPAGATSPTVLPTQISVLSQPPGAEHVSELRVRVRSAHRCDPAVHPLLSVTGPTDVRTLRGDTAQDVVITLFADRGALGNEKTAMGEETSPAWSVLEVTTCGLRDSGMPVGQWTTRLAAYCAEQHLVAFRRETPPPRQWPPGDAPPAPAVRVRREIDGRVIDASALQQGLEALDAQWARALQRLYTAWEREGGITDGRLDAEVATLTGSAGVTWGWTEAPAGLAALPLMRIEALLDLVASRVALRFTGELSRAGSRSSIVLQTDHTVPLKAAWTRRPTDVELGPALAPLSVAIHQGFTLALQPWAGADLAVASLVPSEGTVVRGAITGQVGLELRNDGPGLRWFARLALSPVGTTLRVVDPLLGVQTLPQPLLPALSLLDWSQT